MTPDEERELLLEGAAAAEQMDFIAYPGLLREKAREGTWDVLDLTAANDLLGMLARRKTGRGSEI